MAGAPSQCFPSLASRQWKAVMDNLVKTRSHCTMSPVSGQLCVTVPCGTAAFDQSLPLGLGLACASLILVLLPLHSLRPLLTLAPCCTGSAEVWLCASSISIFPGSTGLSSFDLQESHSPEGWEGMGRCKGGQGPHGSVATSPRERVEIVSHLWCVLSFCFLWSHALWWPVWYRTAAWPCPCGSELWPLSQSRTSVFCVSSDRCLTQLCALNSCSS